MKRSSIKGRLTLLLSAFFLLVLVSALVTFASLETLQQDALVINLAGRQRMLVQQMTREAIELAADPGDALHAQTLRTSSQDFAQTLIALGSGGPAPYLPGQTVTLRASRNPSQKLKISQAAAAWQKFYPQVEVLLASSSASPSFQDALSMIESDSVELVRLSDEVVRGFEALSSAKVNRLRWVQTIFLICALLLLGAGTWIVGRSILAPLNYLEKAASRIGRGELAAPVDPPGPDEMQRLGQNLDEMRAQLFTSHQEAQVWTGQLELRVAQRTQELDALYTVNREISSRLAIQDVLRTITQKTRDLLDCEVVFLCITDENEQSMILNAVDGPEGAIERHSSPLYSPTVSQVLAGERALRCDDGGCRGYCEIMNSRYRASHLAAPLKIQRQIIGALCVGSAQINKFEEDSIEILTKLANIAAVALQNARLYEQAERLATVEERQRIAAEMHDGLAQTLSYTRLEASQAASQAAAGQVDQAIGSLENVTSALDQAIDDTRRAIASLQEHGPVQEPLQTELINLATEYRNGVSTVEFSSSVTVPISLSRQDTHQVLRVAREAVVNAKRHSGATCITMLFQQVDNEYKLIVRDDGRGFDPNGAPGADTPSKAAHFGLNIMRARAARLSGRLEIQSTPGGGTSIGLYWPVKEVSL